MDTVSCVVGIVAGAVIGIIIGILIKEFLGNKMTTLTRDDSGRITEVLVSHI